MVKEMPKSEEKGTEWLAKAAENGNQKAEQELALCYRDGRGVPQSTEKYYAWIEKNADKRKKLKLCSTLLKRIMRVMV